MEEAFARLGSAADWDGNIRETLGRAGFKNFSAAAASLSGGWRKRLAIAEALDRRPTCCCSTSRPTTSISKASSGSKALKGAPSPPSPSATIAISSRTVASEIVEINQAYPNGSSARVAPTRFLEEKEAFLEAQLRRQESLENRVRTEIEWLRRGPKARGTKAKARIDNANVMIGELAEITAATAPRPPPSSSPRAAAKASAWSRSKTYAARWAAARSFAT